MSKGGKANAAPGNGFGAFSLSITTLSYIRPPPDLSAIPTKIIVPFKNLLKTDSTTKTKALEDILAYVKDHPYENGGADESLLEVWVELYPRLSILHSRRIRELSHTLQVEFLKSARKRMEKRIPSIVGPWLAGTFDRDKAVARAATDGLSVFLNSEDKVTHFWRRCHDQILDYAIEAMKETPDTLSDSRHSTEQDAEGTYYRVVGGSLSLVLNLWKRAEPGQIQDKLAVFLGMESVWLTAAAQDAFVRRAFYQLLQVCLDTRPELLKPRLGLIGRVMVADGVKSGQAGSATDFVKVLTSLTRQYPEVWGTKKSPLQRIQPLVEKGSQGTALYWQALDQLLAVLWQKDMSVDSATSFLLSMRMGAAHREEPRANAPYAWACYINTVERFVNSFTPRDAFLESSVYPLTQQYLHPTPELSSWNLPVPPELLPKAWRIVAENSNASIRHSAEEEWQRLADAFLARMSSSLPEVSKEYQKSQQAVAAEGGRWFSLAEAILGQRPQREAEQGQEDAKPSNLQDIVSRTSAKVLHQALDILSRRNYKPFGVATVVQSGFEKCGPTFSHTDSLVEALVPLNDEDKLKSCLASPSSPHLLSCLTPLASQNSTRFEMIWKAVAEVALLKCDSQTAVPVIRSLISNPSGAKLAQSYESLQQFLVAEWLKCARGETCSASWDLSDAMLSFGALTEGSARAIKEGTVRLLGAAQKFDTTLKALEMMLRRKPKWLSEDQDLHVELVAKLLAMTEVSDEGVAGKARDLRALLDQQSDGGDRLAGIIQKNLDDVGPLSLGIDTLVQQATASVASRSVPLEEILPSTNIWMAQLSSFLQEAPNPSLSLTSSLGGAYFTVKENAKAIKHFVKRDRNGRSIPARMAVYTSKLLASGIEITSLPEEFQVELLYLLSLTLELATDQLAVMQADGLWSSPADQDMSTEVEDSISSSQNAINAIVSDAVGWGDSNLEGTSLVERLIRIMLQQTQHLGAMALYSAKALSNLLQALVEARGLPANLEEWFSKQGIMRPTAMFPAIAFLAGFGEALASSKVVNTLCNRLVSDTVGAMPGLEKTLSSVVLLNACMSVYETAEVPVENRRLVFALKQMCTWTETPDEMGSRLAAETCKAIHRILPSVIGVYGPYWEQTIKYCIQLWNHAGRDSVEARLPYIHSSLKLMSALETTPEPNDDLVDALKEYSEHRSKALLELLKVPRDEITPASQIVDVLLCRSVEKIPLAHLKDLPDLYPLVASNSREIQTAAFGLLHRALPVVQEELSVNILLENKNARLPDELLSLLLDAPTLESYPEDVLVQFPAPIRSYLLAWHLIFDAYSTAGFKVRNDYTECLKGGNYVGPLMDFMFDVLGHSAAHALNLDKEGFTVDHIRSYDIKLADSEPEERGMLWLLIHLFYQTLRYTPGLFRSWYLECRSKQTKNAVEPWTQKYFSPLIISDTLDEVEEWVGKLEPPAEDEKELQIRISRAAREVIASYEVDEEIASMSIKIPQAFPVEYVSVVGINRVAVDEKRWQSWLKTAQGAITFANGSIVDGLTTFRRNVQGALKGQMECAICYSIVSSDRMLPDKKCKTCRNPFHRICLYKWFQTSNQNSCPLCRNPIDYIGSDTQARRVK
ncbi:hypothetical protein QBC46DRAFT_338629 [Diplogelasinospora grovesii]|uniref:E3 ubiquitin-protein ligase listerin n=1 Tax=Diplogelasinospora grovesii TaxID=303347 RepID=A0AAN6NEK6_9PEZI|nr:hypothetical protein QBC46DRAFT_338629 [Diplogelasinospora grovesii]